MTCSEKIRLYRQREKMTVDSLAQKAGIKPERLAGMEEPGATHAIIDLMRIARALGIHSIELFGDEQVRKDSVSRACLKKQKRIEP